MRTIMSFVGILCCNALIIASLGLQDSVNALAENHYTKALCYDVRANLTGETDEAESYRRRLDAEGVNASWKNRSVHGQPPRAVPRS